MKRIRWQNDALRQGPGLAQALEDALEDLREEVKAETISDAAASFLYANLEMRMPDRCYYCGGKGHTFEMCKKP